MENKYENFKELIWAFYQEHGRSFAWRHVTDPYKVLVSEIMLQQTQTNRVIEKYEQFMAEFSTVHMLADASLRDVLSIWQGLGYNRRGLYLHQAAQRIVNEHDGIVPAHPDQLVRLPGIGKATASSIAAFAYNVPTVFIETNIRAVFIHFFFSHAQHVDDKDIMPHVAATVDQTNPREWYYALMDYGVMLKRATGNPSRKSKHYVRQSTFEGSDRQVRGAIIRLLTEYSTVSIEELRANFTLDSDRLTKIIKKLCDDELIVQTNRMVRISSS